MKSISSTADAVPMSAGVCRTFSHRCRQMHRVHCLRCKVPCQCHLRYQAAAFLHR
ncbi:MAG: hypothetical protein MZV63_05475 [Marinilabiliales bacterium]|nr:hypothetical protein [Marinilabiliales bacterium]